MQIEGVVGVEMDNILENSDGPPVSREQGVGRTVADGEYDGELALDGEASEMNEDFLLADE